MRFKKSFVALLVSFIIGNSLIFASSQARSQNLDSILGNALGRVLSDQLNRQNGAQEQPQRAQPQTSQRPSEVPLSRSQRQQVQAALNFLGFPVGVEDGVFGNGTRTGIANWQHENGYQKNGYLTAEQYQTLDQSYQQAVTSGQSISRPLSTAEARELQTLLQDLGYYQGRIDGQLGSGSGRAVESYLTDRAQNPYAMSTYDALEMLRKETGRDVTVRSSGSSTSSVRPTANAPQVFALEEREVIRFDEFSGAETDKILIAALIQLPDFSRAEIVRSQMSSQKLKDFVTYSENAWQNPTEVARVSSEIGELPIPTFDRVSLAFNGNFQRVLVEVNQLSSPPTEMMDVRVQVSTGTKIGEYSSIALLPGSGIQLELEAPGMPDLESIILSTEQAREIYSNRGKFPQHGTVYVHLDVEEFSVEPATGNLVMRTRLEGVDFRGRVGRSQEESVAYVYPMAQGGEVSLAEKGISKLEQLTKLFFDEQKRLNPRAKGPRFIDGELDLRTAGYGSNAKDIHFLSAMLSINPGLLNDDEFAVDLGALLLTVAERRKVFRGTTILQNGRLNGSNNWYKTLDAFERRDVARRIRDEMRAQIEERSFNEPLDIIYVEDVVLDDYNFEMQEFPLRSYPSKRRFDQSAGGIVGSTFGPLWYAYDEAFVPPTSIPIPEAEARVFLGQNNLATGSGPKMAIHMTLPPLNPDDLIEKNRSSGLPERQIVAQIRRVVLYADEDLRAPIFEYEGVATSAQKRTQNGRTPLEVLSLPVATQEELIGTALLTGGQESINVMDAIARRTPSYSIIADDKKEAYAKLIEQNYVALGNEDGVWVDGLVYFLNPDAETRTIDLVLAPSLRTIGRTKGIEDARIGLSDLFDNSILGKSTRPLFVDDDLLNKNGSLFSNHQYDGGISAVFESASGQEVTGHATGSYEFGYKAKLRIKPKINGIRGKIESGNRMYVSFLPNVVEYYLLIGHPEVPGDLRIVAHENLERGSSQVIVGTSVSAPARKITSSAVLEIRKTGTEGLPTTGVVYNCIDPSGIPPEHASSNAIKLPVSPQEAGVFYSDFIGDDSAWITTAECLQTAIAALTSNGSDAAGLRIRAIGESSTFGGDELAQMVE